MATAFVWLAVFTIHQLDLPAGLAEWNATHQDWAIDEFTLVSLCVAVALGIFSWRRWQESARTLARYQTTLDQLHTTEDQVASQDDLIRSVSHELRTPLTAVLGYAELLGGTDLDALERTEVVDTIVREGRDLSNIVEDLITRARSEAATLEVALVRVSLAGQAAQVLESRSSADRDSIARRLDPEAFATGDPARVRQILRNLLSNAFKYGEGGVEISAISDGEKVGLSISNRGAGIPESDHEKIFDPYHRVRGTGPNPGGLGLGLAISRQLARMMGGDLAYRYESGRSFFDLSLTRFVEAPETPDTPEWAEEVPSKPKTSIFDGTPTTPEDPVVEEMPEAPETPPLEELPATPDESVLETIQAALDAPLRRKTPNPLETPTWTEKIPPETPVTDDTSETPEIAALVEEIPTPETPILGETPDTAHAPIAFEVPTSKTSALDETPDTSEIAVSIEEIQDTPVFEIPDTSQTAVVDDTPYTPQEPTKFEVPDTPQTMVMDDPQETPEAAAWTEEIRETPETPAWMEETPPEGPVLEEIPDTPAAPTDETPETPEMHAWMEETPPEAPVLKEIPDTSVRDEIPENPQTTAWMEETPPEAPVLEEIPDTPAAPTGFETSETRETPNWMAETPPETPVTEESAPEAPVRVGVGPFDFLGFEGQDQHL